MPFPWQPGMRTTADRLNARNTHVVEQGTNQLINNTTTYVDTDLAFEGAAGGVYEYRVLAAVRANSAADLKFQWTVPSGTGSNRFSWTAGLGASASGSATTIDQVSMHIPAGPGSDGFAGGLGSTVSLGYQEEGIFVIGGTAGTLTLRFAQNTAHASDAEFRSFSRLIYRRVG